MKHRQIAESYGFRILPRADFLDAKTNLIEKCGVDQDGHLFEALKARASKINGAFILFDPDDSDEGWLLVGDDADQLAKNTVEELDLKEVRR
jgi:hypothetical protein